MIMDQLIDRCRRFTRDEALRVEQVLVTNFTEYREPFVMPGMSLKTSLSFGVGRERVPARLVVHWNDLEALIRDGVHYRPSSDQKPYETLFGIPVIMDPSCPIPYLQTVETTQK